MPIVVSPEVANREPPNPDACPPHAWYREARVTRYGCVEAWVCAKCGAGDATVERDRQAVRECVDDR